MSPREKFMAGDCGRRPSIEVTFCKSASSGSRSNSSMKMLLRAPIEAIRESCSCLNNPSLALLTDFGCFSPFGQFWWRGHTHIGNRVDRFPDLIPRSNASTTVAINLDDCSPIIFTGPMISITVVIKLTYLRKLLTGLKKVWKWKIHTCAGAPNFQRGRCRRHASKNSNCWSPWRPCIVTTFHIRFVRGDDDFQFIVAAYGASLSNGYIELTRPSHWRSDVPKFDAIPPNPYLATHCFMVIHAAAPNCVELECPDAAPSTRTTSR